MTGIEVLVCDNHDVFREGIKSILAREPDIDVVGETSGGGEAIELAKSLEPDVVLMDLTLPDMSGVEAARGIKEALPGTQVFILSMFGNTDTMSRCLEAGADGFLVKDLPVAQLLSAIRTAGPGNTESAPTPAPPPRVSAVARPSSALGQISAREKEVLVLLAEGYSFKEIADRLFLSVKTVDSHKYNLMRKLGLRSRPELIRFAIREGLIQA